MFVHKNSRALLAALAGLGLLLPAARADEPSATASPGPQLIVAPALSADARFDTPTAAESPSLLQQTSASIEATLNNALELIGVRYRRGGVSPESGFDCSGFVGHVFREGLGLYLPHSAKAMSKTGSPVARNELKPGDLVFFNTMRRAVSHVGIYLGDNLFVHAPRSGGKVRIEDLTDRYWVRHFNGARRLVDDPQG